jgi:hypothetical protein
MDPVPLPLHTIRAAFTELGRSVSVALRTQMGDTARLGVQKRDCLRLLGLTEQVNKVKRLRESHSHFHKHAAIITSEERAIIDKSINTMIECLDNAAHLSSDPPDAPPLETSYTVYTGEPGRPSVQIPPGMLATALGMRGTSHLTQIFNCSARTIRRRALEYGLAEPGPPVYIEYEHDDGTTFKFYSSSSGSTSDISDDDLDEITSQIVAIFPNFGRRMIDGHLKHLGHRVPRSRVQASYSRVNGAPASSFGPRRIQRRVYSVPGPNSLCHHDGQHGEFYLSVNSFYCLTRSFYQG